jgi:carbonic anhydrase/acetyltransferase-like protein (isoleucine patch superfamily)
MALYQIGLKRPTIHPRAYISEHAVIIGDVEIGEGASVWPGAVLRGDAERIVIGREVNVQDAAVIHADPGFPVNIEAGASIGHQAMLHGCSIGENTVIGIQSVILNGATIRANSLIGAAAFIGEGKSFPERSLIFGAPARVIRELEDEIIADLRAIAKEYRERGEMYASELTRID